jgi:ribosome recycling factor
MDQLHLSQVSKLVFLMLRTYFTAFEKYIHPIEKAIMIANIGFNPMNNGDVIIISVPTRGKKT